MDFTSKDAVVNTIMKAQIVQDDKTVDVATTPVKDGWSSVSVKVPTAKGLVSGEATTVFTFPDSGLSHIHIRRCRRLLTCRSRWSPYH